MIVKLIMWPSFLLPRLIPSCKLEIQSVVNFGTLVANSKVYSKEVTINNHGKAPGKCFLSYLLTLLEVLVLFEMYTLCNRLPNLTEKSLSFEIAQNQSSLIVLL